MFRASSTIAIIVTHETNEKSRKYNRLICGATVEERSRMRSIDDIIDKLDTWSVDRGPDESQSATVTQSAADASDEGTLRANTATDRQARQMSAGDGVLPVQTDDRRRRRTVGSGNIPLSTADDPRLDRPCPTSAASLDAEPLWKMFGTPLGQLCRRLLTDSQHSKTHIAAAKTESVEPQVTDITVRARTTAPVSKNLRPGAEVQPEHASVDVHPLSSSRVDVVRSNGRTERHKPPLPTKPSLPAKPPIAKKPSFGRDTSAGLVRKASSLSSPCTSSSSSTHQPQTCSTSFQQSSSNGAGGPSTASNSAPTSPTVGVIEREVGQRQQSSAAAAQRTAGGVTTTAKTRRSDHATPTSEKTKQATSGDDQSMFVAFVCFNCIFQLNPFNASRSKLLLFEGFGAILV